MKMSKVKSMVMTAMCIALGVVLPIMFHSVENAGSIFCPMHIPVLICGLICGWKYGFFVGLILGGVPILFNKIKEEMKSIPNYIIFIILYL